jgi:predicted enzyme related to lactoylglutathione lyase
VAASKEVFRMAANRIVHFEIPADRPEGLVRFYAELFGWRIEKAPIPNMDYYVCHTGEGPGIDGGIMRRAAPEQAVTNYVKVEQVDPVLEKARALGARVVVPRTAVPGMGWFAVALDPDGNPVGFWQDDRGAS